MTAKDMFKGLGYKNKREKYGKGIYMKYQKSVEEYDYYIVFYLNERTVTAYQYEYGEIDSKNITVQELKAINKKCKELGWLD